MSEREARLQEALSRVSRADEPGDPTEPERAISPSESPDPAEPVVPAPPPEGPRPFPDSSDFSVGLIAIPMNGPIALRRLLAIIEEGRGERPTIVEGIRATFFDRGKVDEQANRAANTLRVLNDNNYRLLQPGRWQLND